MSDEHATLVIYSRGDLILDVAQDESTEHFWYRVDSTLLKQNSRYFQNLLSDRFSEGQHLSSTLANLKHAGFSDVADAPPNALPRISIRNIGRVSVSKASSIQVLIADFLRALHGVDLAVIVPVSNLANLAVVADRFDALPHMSQIIQRKKYMQAIEAKSRGKASIAMTEERARQKLLIGLLFDHPSWVTKFSKYIILRDSVQWQPGMEEDSSKALWWDLPDGVENELIRRREYLLETINSLQAHFLKLYTSGDRQCRLGYDTSLQCDSFQLGEMVRFFHKIDTVRLQGKIYDNSEPTYYLGDVERLLSSLRQCSNYQVDKNHAHCGLRSRLLPLLDTIQHILSSDASGSYIGICADCWSNHRLDYAWSSASAKPPVMWTFSRTWMNNRTFASGLAQPGTEASPRECQRKHAVVRDLFLARERNWTAGDVQ